MQQPLTPFGTQAVRARFDGADLPVVQTALLENPLPGQLEVIAGADTIVVTATGAAALPGLVDALARIRPAPTAPLLTGGHPFRSTRSTTVKTFPSSPPCST